MAFGHLRPTNSPTFVQFGPDDFHHLFHKDTNGTTIIQYARLYAMDIATQIVTHFAEAEDSMKPEFDVATEAIALETIQGLPSASDEWKTKYGKQKIRIRVRGNFIIHAKPLGFLITMSIEGLSALDRGFKAVFQDIIGFVPIKKPGPPSTPDSEEPAPSVSPDDADRSA